MVGSMVARRATCERMMARALKRLTVKKIEKLLRKGVAGVHADGAGLYLRIRSKSSASWEKQYQPRGAVPRITRTGKVGWPVKYMGLGSAFDVSLAAAREANQAANILLKDKIDPLTQRRAEHAARLAEAAKQRTFGQVGVAFYTSHVHSWDERHAAQWRRSVLGETPSGQAPKSDLCKALRAMPVASITTQTVVDVSFAAGYWDKLYGWYRNGGIAHVAAYLAALDITSFDPKAPPPKTPAFWDIVEANRAPEDAELQDTLDKMGNPNATTLNQVKTWATGEFSVWIADRKNRRVIPHRLERCGYAPVRNDYAKDGLWKIGEARQTIYAKSDLSRNCPALC
jgi:hypothetical protein